MKASTPNDLANHAETLSDYLYDYGLQPSMRTVYSRQFFDYLLSACWRKLYRRFSSWQGLGLIRNFEERVDLLQRHLDIIGTPAGPNKTFMDRGPGDHTLAIFLHRNRVVIFESMLPSVLQHDMHSPPPKSVFDDFREAVVNANDKDDLMGLYTQKTALGFHYFVYCAFLLAGQAIRAIYDSYEPLAKNGASTKKSYTNAVKNFKDDILAAVLPMKLLQYVLGSTIFKRHIEVWTNDGACLEQLLPKWPQKKDNLIFGKRRHILGSSKKGPLGVRPTESGNEVGEIPNMSHTEDDHDGDKDEDEVEVCKPI